VFKQKQNSVTKIINFNERNGRIGVPAEIQEAAIN
jgi:hypothetical protein